MAMTTPTSSPAIRRPTSVLLVIAGIALGLSALVLGLTPISRYGVNCGSAMSANGEALSADFYDTLRGNLPRTGAIGGVENACDAARSDRLPWVWVLGIGAAGLVTAAYVTRSAARSTAQTDPESAADAPAVDGPPAPPMRADIGALWPMVVSAWSSWARWWSARFPGRPPWLPVAGLAAVLVLVTGGLVVFGSLTTGRDVQVCRDLAAGRYEVLSSQATADALLGSGNARLRAAGRLARDDGPFLDMVHAINDGCASIGERRPFPDL